MVHHVKNLSHDQKLVIEALLGRPVSEEEAVSVRAVVPAAVVPSTLSVEQRKTALEGLHGYFDKADSRRKPVSEAEEEAIITEAIRSVRPTYKAVD